MTIVYKSSIDLFLYVVGSSHENEVNSEGWGDEEGLAMGKWLGVWAKSWVLRVTIGTFPSGLCGLGSSQNGFFQG